jgi:starch synthase
VNVLFVVAELAPLAKVGGVGDVAGALPKALRQLGCDVRVALPYYQRIRSQEVAAQREASLPDGAALWRADAGDVPLYLIEHEPSFGREQVYGYDDDVERFLIFCRSVLAASGPINWRPDVLHLHDWHAGLVATLVAHPGHAWSDAARLFTIHNLGYRGDFMPASALAHGLPPEALAPPPGLDAALPYSALAQGLLHADLVNTVSPTYAREILSSELAGDLAPLLGWLGERLSGVLNGIDAETYDPATDPHLVERFDAATLERRGENKRALQETLGLAVQDRTPVVGMVTRLFEQKGSDIAAAAFKALLRGAGPAFQIAVLGQGAPEYERQLTDLAARHPERVAVRIAFDPALGQLIYGGCDIFLMPSRYEPCGLGQMMAMRYGAVPLVRRTGGLADTVQPFDAERDSGTGFLFDDATPEALIGALRTALNTFAERDAWARLQRRCMAQDFSWDRAAREYEALYRRAIARRRQT